VSTYASLSYDLLAPENLEDPYPLYSELRAHSPVHRSESLGGWALTSYAAVHAGLRAADLSAARFAPNVERLVAKAVPASDPQLRLLRGLTDWFTFADPPGHTRLRTLTRDVMLRPMKAATPYVDRLLGDLLDRAADRGEIDIVQDLGRPLSLGVIVEMLGVPVEDRDRFIGWTDALTDFIGGALNVPDRRARAEVAYGELSDYLGALVAERRANPTGDLLSGLALPAKNGDVMSDSEVVATAAMFLFAGHGTTTHLLGNGILALLRHPDKLRWLGEHPEASEGAVEELLRYDSSVQITVRVATRDGAAGIPDVEAGDRVFLFIAAGNRDESRFPSAEELDLERGEKGHLSFGYGIHFCLGAPLARVEAPAALRGLTSRFTDFELAIDTLPWQPTVGFRGLDSLPLRIRNR
jgi:cytochrome P450